MSKVLFRMINGEQKAHFEASDAAPEVQIALVKGMFAAMGVAEPHPVVTIKAEPLLPASPFALEDYVAPLRSTIMEESPATLMQKQIREVQAAKQEIATASATVVKEPEAEPKFTTSIAELMMAKRPAWIDADTTIAKANDKAALNEVEESMDFGFHYVTNESLTHSATDDAEIPEHFKTGYKIGPQGERLYKLRYWCGRCSFKGNHYVPEDTKTVDCYQCNSTLTVHKAVPKTVIPEPDAFRNWYIAGLQKPVRIVTQEQYNKLKSRASR